MRLLSITVFVGWVLASWSLPSSAADLYFPSKYDRQIERSVSRWWPVGHEWYWWKAQLYQESRLNPLAVSPVGARGLAQFMPGTWSDVSQKLNLPGVSPHVAGPAIDAGAFYMAGLARQWSAPRSDLDRWDLARASYNAGLGNLLAAQRRCGGVAPFDGIMACLPAVTGRHSKETIDYVDRIHRWYMRMKSCQRC